MKKVDLDTLDFLEGKITKQYNLLFRGEENNTFSLVFQDDFSELRTKGFYKIIQNKNVILIDKIYVFNSIKDVIVLYTSKDKSYFNSSIIMITDQTALKESVNYIRKTNVKNIVFHHQTSKEDLFLLYFDLLENVHYKVAINDNGDKIFNIIYKTHTLNLKVNQLSQAINFLGKYEKFFRVKNNYLKTERILPKIIW